MILKALANGVPEKHIADALSVDVANIRQKRDMLNGICPEAVELLRNKQVAIEVFSILRKMKPVRQVEAAEHMLAGAAFSTLGHMGQPSALYQVASAANAKHTFTTCFTQAGGNV